MPKIERDVTTSSGVDEERATETAEPEPAKTDHPTGDDQAEENRELEPPA
jgi:hypothetical protein